MRCRTRMTLHVWRQACAKHRGRAIMLAHHAGRIVLPYLKQIGSKLYQIVVLLTNAI
jgi:hypothetical protein